MSPKLFDDRTARADEGDDPTTRTLARGPVSLLIGRHLWSYAGQVASAGFGIDDWTCLTTRTCRILFFVLLIPLVSKIERELRVKNGNRGRKRHSTVVLMLRYGRAILVESFRSRFHRPFWPFWTWDDHTPVGKHVTRNNTDTEVWLDKLLRLFSSNLALDWSGPFTNPFVLRSQSEPCPWQHD